MNLLRHILAFVIALVLTACVGADTSPTSTGGAATTTESGGASSTGGTGGTTTTSSTTTTTTDPGIVLGPPTGCSGNESIAPATGQLGYHEEGAFACTRITPPAGHSRVRSFAPAVGLTPSCVVLPSAVWFIAPIDQAWPIDLSDPAYSYVETPITDDNTEPQIAVNVDVPDGSAFYACLRLIVDADGGVSCTTASYCPDAMPEDLSNMLFSSTGGGKTILAFPQASFEPLSESPDPALAAQIGNDHRAWNTTVTLD